MPFGYDCRLDLKTGLGKWCLQTLFFVMVSRKGTAMGRILPVVSGTSDRSGNSDVAAIPYVSQLSGLSVDEFPRVRRIDTQQAPPIPPRGFQIHARTKKTPTFPAGTSPPLPHDRGETGQQQTNFVQRAAYCRERTCHTDPTESIDTMRKCSKRSKCPGRRIYRKFQENFPFLNPCDSASSDGRAAWAVNHRSS